MLSDSQCHSLFNGDYSGRALTTTANGAPPSLLYGLVPMALSNIPLVDPDLPWNTPRQRGCDRRLHRAETAGM